MRIRSLMLMLAVISSVVTAAGGEWQKRDSGVLAWLYTVEFLDAERGFAAGSNGTVLATLDGGATWQKLHVPSSDTIRDVHFVDRLNGWMLCDRGRAVSGKNPTYLMRTIDGGKTWAVVELANSRERFSRMFFASDGAFLVGEGGVILGLPEVGKSEARHLLPVKFRMLDGVIVGGSRMILVGGGGTLIFSDDNGRSWQNPAFPLSGPAQKLNSVFFADSANGWAAGAGGMIFFSGDGGRSWGPQASGTEAEFLDVGFYDPANGFAVGEGGIVLGTSNRGVTWTAEKSGTRHRLERIAFAGKRPVAVGFGGTIITAGPPDRQYMQGREQQ